MENLSDSAIRERGGVPLKDYTESGLPALRSKNGLSSVWKNINFDMLGRFLIFPSLGLGLAELLMPRSVLKLIGVREKKYSGLVRLMGLRELTSAFMIFSQSRPLTGVWSRVIGDALDLGLLAAASNTRRANKNRLATAAAVVGGITAVDLMTAKQIGRVKSEVKQISDFTREDLDDRTSSGAFRVTRSITINRPADELYRYWRNFENLPNFMLHLKDVRVLDDRRSRWTAKAPAGTTVEWEGEITEDPPDLLSAWSSLPDADVKNSGEVRFEPAPRNLGTVVRVQIDYHPPAGRLGKIVASLFGEEPGQQVSGDLRRFKQVVETGEVTRSDGAHHGTGQKIPRPARPLADDTKERKNKGVSKWDLESKRAKVEDTVRDIMRD